MKFLSKTILVILLSISTHAQNAQKAKELLNEVSKKAKSYQNIVIDFKYNLVNTKEKINQESKGNVAIEGSKYVLNFMGVTKIYDGKKTYTIVPEDEEITISNGKEKDNDLTPDKLLTFFEKGYTYSWGDLQDIKGRKIQYVKLTPTDKKSKIKEVLVGIDKQTKHIYSVTHTDTKNTKTTITVNSFKTNQSLSKNHFTFTESKYPNYYINRID